MGFVTLPTMRGTPVISFLMKTRKGLSNRMVGTFVKFPSLKPVFLVAFVDLLLKVSTVFCKAYRGEAEEVGGRLSHPRLKPGPMWGPHPWRASL